MGYTHYWRATRDLNDAEWAEVTAAVKKIIKAAEGKTTMTAGGYYKHDKVKICGSSGSGKPEFGPKNILLNGNAPVLDHETFAITRFACRDFCKTARKPYDVVVVACLSYLAHKWGYEVSSDGDVLDWEDGVVLANVALGEIIPHPLIVSQLAA